MKIDDVKKAIGKYGDVCVCGGVGIVDAGFSYRAYTNGNIPGCIACLFLATLCEAASVYAYLKRKDKTNTN